jgi:hypothetical protein
MIDTMPEAVPKIAKSPETHSCPRRSGGIQHRRFGGLSGEYCIVNHSSLESKESTRGDGQVVESDWRGLGLVVDLGKCWPADQTRSEDM